METQVVSLKYVYIEHQLAEQFTRPLDELRFELGVDKYQLSQNETSCQIPKLAKIGGEPTD